MSAPVTRPLADTGDAWQEWSARLRTVDLVELRPGHADAILATTVVHGADLWRRVHRVAVGALLGSTVTVRRVTDTGALVLRIAGLAAGLGTDLTVTVTAEIPAQEAPALLDLLDPPAGGPGWVVPAATLAGLAETTPAKTPAGGE